MREAANRKRIERYVAASILVLAGMASTLPAQQTGADLLARAEQVHSSDAAAARRLIDQAIILLRRPVDSAARMKALDRRCWWAVAADPISAVPIAEQSIADAVAHGDAATSADLHLCHGYGLEAMGKSDQARGEYELGVREGERLGEKKLTADALLLRGQLSYTGGEMNGALEDLQKAYAIDASLDRKDEKIAALNAIANVYADTRVAEYDKAIEYYRQILAANVAAGASSEVSTAHFNLGSTYEQKGDFATALDEYRQALRISQQRNSVDDATDDEHAIGVVLGKMGRPAEAIGWLDRALTYYRKVDPERTAATELSRAIALRKLGRIPEALIEFDAARIYFESVHNSRFLEKLQDESAQAMATAGDWKRAYEARTSQLALDKALSEKLNLQKTSRMRVQFDSEKKEGENRALSRENALRGEALRAARKIRTLQSAVIALSALIMAILGYLIVRQVQNAKKLRRLAMTDELTRIPNRRHVFLIAEDQMAAAKKEGTPFSLLALDVDHFKRINDTWGHDKGDIVLQRVAHACGAALRGGDRIGRTGGEEFMVILPATSSAVAVDVAERLRRAVEMVPFHDIDRELRVTVSIGVSQWSPSDDFGAIAKRADDSLYKAKEAGRNRVELAFA